MTQPEIKEALLISRAIEARERAYAPYSQYKVGAAVQTDTGDIYTGVNVENAVYPLCLCAERVAITKAISEGAQRIVAVAVATANAGTPCGSCRQVMREFGDPAIPVFITTPEGRYRTRTLADLLPEGFSVTDLETCKG